ncbi:MAG: hypothetical protein BZ138_08315 [Methanosphaera sp. rholeuAM270]|nr:MAG: hypothetical protein BZ138_08315 [Methanosphaera sp. rholeuAM270]
MSNNYEAPVLVLSLDTIRHYACEDAWDWVGDHPEAIPDVLDDAASALEPLIQEYSVRDAIEEAISAAQRSGRF